MTMKRKKIAICSFFAVGLIALIGFHSRPITGNSEGKSFRFPSGLLPDPYELYESIPKLQALDDIKPPKSFDLSESFPQPGDQGTQKSSAGFAVAYGLISFLEAERTNKKDISELDPLSEEGGKNLYSPSFLYNQLNGGKDTGASLLETLILAQSRGSVTWEQMGYNPSQFRNRPGAGLIEEGRKTRISRIFKIDPSDLQSIKAAISEKNPVIISFLTYENFLSAKGSSVYQSESGNLVGAQSLVLVGYDDGQKTFRVWNSWGKEWGDKGYLSISYPIIQKLTRSAYIGKPTEDMELLTEKQVFNVLNKIPSKGRDLRPPSEVFASKGEFKDKIRIVWTKDSKAIGYEVYRKRKGESKFQMVGLSRQSFFEDAGVQKNLAYTYRVASLDETRISLPSSDSNDGFASEEVKITDILPITNLKANVAKTNDRIELEWDSHITADQYSVYKWNPAIKIFRFLGKTNKPVYIDYKASRNGDSEIYRVFPHGKNRNGEGSSYVSAHLDPSESVKPKPTGLAVTKGVYINKVLLEWDGSPAAHEYAVFRRKNADENWEKIGNTKDTSFADSNPPLTENDYSVSAIFSEQRYSQPSEVETGFASILSKRAELSKTPELTRIVENLSKKEVTLVWKKNPSVEQYTVYSRRKQETEWKKVAQVPGSASEVSVPGLEKNQFYFFILKAKETGKEESIASQPFIAVLSDIVADLKKIKTFGESTITKFVGPWTAMYWDGKSSVKQVRLEIQPEETEDSYILKWNNQEFYRGKNIVDSNLLEEKGRWRIKLSPNQDSLSGEFLEKDLLPEKGYLSFVRE
ncbi:cysteine protease [Leptospira idonii]|uniref:Cysteine protease n=2 Tax=Leptospira idonii TaxID=1193500 RepID=A0A4R9M1F2_9LEPT|nr:cysteine protease [Leptospira idonii]